MSESSPSNYGHSTNLMDSYGACLVALCLSYALWGINVIQCFYYCNSPRRSDDHWATHILVGWLWICETVRITLISRGIMDPLVLRWGDKSSLPLASPYFVWQNLFYGLIAVPAQGFYLYRIYIMTNRTLYLLIPMVVLLAWEFVGLLVYIGKTWVITLAITASNEHYLTSPNLSANVALNRDVVNTSFVASLIEAVIGTGLALDVIITTAVIIIILREKTQNDHKHTEALLSRLLFFTVNTGLWTTLLAIALMINIAVNRHSLTSLALEFLTSGFYVTSVLANLNGRAWIRSGNRDSSKYDSDDSGNTELSIWRAATRPGNNETMYTTYGPDTDVEDYTHHRHHIREESATPSGHYTDDGEETIWKPRPVEKKSKN